MEVLFTFLAERHERKSVMISSNFAFSQWDRIFKDPMTTAAGVDRLVHQSTILGSTALAVASSRPTSRGRKRPTTIRRRSAAGTASFTTTISPKHHAAHPKRRRLITLEHPSRGSGAHYQDGEEPTLSGQQREPSRIVGRRRRRVHSLMRQHDGGVQLEDAILPRRPVSGSKPQLRTARLLLIVPHRDEVVDGLAFVVGTSKRLNPLKGAIEFA